MSSTACSLSIFLDRLLIVEKMLGLVCAMMGLAAAELGVSVALVYQSFVPNQETYACLREEGVTFAVVGVIEPCTGVVVQGAPSNIRAAKAAGLQVEAYLNPCMPCMNGTAQASAVWKSVGHEVDFIWAGQYSGCANPSTNLDWNHQFASSIVTTLAKADARVGVNAEVWGYVMGNWDGLKHFPLWYSGNNQSDFSDFKVLGGWTKPAMKTMNREQLCNITVSTLYRP